ncbi:hypothetical protein J5N97_029754 [Dioscorea zingiberensis]|uniref:serine C-palmitoyltransferase n=1 Tax=Dioscorea zingiberensis TaxID=325984 RepID=A0A9D5BW95_9LILI|nr:hypothetical protein J5N97_029754 [Dioscorea zingiberensis]
MESWDGWVGAALSKLAAKNLLRSLRPISLPSSNPKLEIFDGPRAWDRSSVEVELDEDTFQEWLQELPNPEGEQKMILFSGNDYLGLSAHPALRIAASEAALAHGMGPRGSALICGYTNYHMQVEALLADLKKKEDCLLCPTGFSANMAFMTALGSVSSLLAVSGKPSEDERIAIFSDALNHASIIDGMRLAERQKEAEVFVYRHSDMNHLSTLLSSCTLTKKVVVTDSLFSMDGDFAPMADLIKLRNKHHFLLVIDDAHATLVCGRNGGGVPEAYECEDDVDICIGTLSKAAGCQGGFIACSHKWKQLIQSRGRSFIFSTALPVPLVAASHASLTVAKQEKWRRRAIWSRVHDFRSLTLLPITSPVISLVVGNEAAALLASRHMLKSGFHVTAIRPPTVPPDSCRLRITLSAAHTTDDVRRLVTSLSQCFKLPAFEHNGLMASKL